MNDGQLLNEFVEQNSQSAFRTLMERHLPLVYGTARRITGNEGVAEDVAQTVFLLLARKARADLKLTGWLYNTTRFVAARALRSEIRRSRREQEAATMNDPDPIWQHVVPKLDDALAALNETDRNAILFRFFEQRGLREVGEALGVTEEAAKKRVARALEKLRRILGRRGMDVSAAALVAGLTYEASAIPVGLAAKVTTATLAKLTTTEAAGLLAEVIAAMQWAKIKLVGAAAITIALLTALVPLVSNRISERTASRAPAGVVAPNTPSLTDGSARAGQVIPQRGIRVTVLDEATDSPIVGAEVTHSMMAWVDNTPPAATRTDASGAVDLRLPEMVGELAEREQFEVWVRAAGYARKSIIWLCTTGAVLATVTNDYIIRLERGITLSGTVVDESGQPLVGVLVGGTGNDYRGYTSYRNRDGIVVSKPEFRVDEVGTFFAQASATGPNAIITDYQGQFEMPHCPSNLQGLHIEFVLPDGSRRKFRTPMGARLSTESLPEISIEDLRRGTARFVIARGVTVEGVVVDAKGKAVPGAEVLESVQVGNLRVLSRNRTDQFGQFRLENRAPREVILSAMALGHASVCAVVNIASDMKPVRLQLPPEQPLCGTVAGEFGQPIANASIGLVDYRGDGIGLEWTTKTDEEGRFMWRGAPTNELLVAVDAKGFT